MKPVPSLSFASASASSSGFTIFEYNTGQDLNQDGAIGYLLNGTAYAASTR